jgi:hypothetical protein
MVGVGLGVVILLYFLTGPAVATCGLIPLFIGLAMLIYVHFLAAPIA